MSLMATISFLFVLAAFAGYINHRLLKLPSAIGLMVITLNLSFLMIFLGKQGFLDSAKISAFIHSINFSETILHGMLAYLLFAGALHVDLNDLAGQKLPISALSTIGVLIATTTTGTLFWLVANQLGFKLSFLYALLFGALISPTDPIAVLGIIKTAGVPKSLEVKIAGESLFNDGIGVAVFLTIFSLATGLNELDPQNVVMLLAKEALGGIGLGIALGWFAYRLVKSVDAYQVEVLITLGLAGGGYSLAEYFHFSAPIAIVVAGLIMGNHGRTFGMSEKTLHHLDNFWELLDEILNSILFVLIGLEIIVLDIGWDYFIVGLCAIPTVLIGRFISVLIPVRILENWHSFSKNVIPVLTWGGLRGGISVALALSIPSGPERSIIVSATYLVVVFSVIVQGLTLKKFIRLTGPNSAQPSETQS